jgi:tyrosyl-tRNA synthetase
VASTEESIAAQLHVIESGTADIVPASDLADKLERGTSLRIKLGVDPTAPDLHLGHAVPLRKLRQFQDLGHTVVLIIGDFTALIGDPSGRSATRPALTRTEIEANARTYMEQAFRILDEDKTELRRNSEWLEPLDLEEIIGLTSRFTIARILERDDFSKRYRKQEPISLHEFLYPVMQAYDSVAIEADVEIGGTDQLFNLLAGRDLMEKMGVKPQVCLTLPLLEGTDGMQKMSKSYGNYIGLTDEPDDMFGKVMSIPDELMVKYYRLATKVPVDEIDSIERSLEAGETPPNEAKRRLAREIVELYHGERAAETAEQAFDRLFKEQKAPEDMPVAAPRFVTEDGPNVGEPPAEDPKVSMTASLVAADLTSSNGDARRMIDQGAVRIDGERLAPGNYEVPWEAEAGEHPTMHDGSVVQVGKRRWARFTVGERSSP